MPNNLEKGIFLTMNPEVTLKDFPFKQLEIKLPEREAVAMNRLAMQGFREYRTFGLILSKIMAKFFSSFT